MSAPAKSILAALCVLGLLVAAWVIAGNRGGAGDLGQPPPPPAQALGIEPPSEGDPSGPLTQLDRPAEPPASPARTAEPYAPEKRVFEGPKGPFELTVRVLDSRSHEPLENYLVMIGLTGSAAYPDELPSAQRLPTDARGECQWPELGEIGPWDIYVTPVGYEGALYVPDEDIKRVATIMARSILSSPPPVAADDLTQGNGLVQGTGGTHVILVKTGPKVTYRGPLPEGVRPEDLRFDVRGKIHVYSSNSDNTRGIGRGRPTPEGWVTAALPQLSNSFTGPNFAVRIWTADGNFGDLSSHPGTLTNETDVIVEGPLKSRAKVRFRVVLEASDDGSRAATAQEIAHAVSWEALGTDPERSGSGQNGSGPLSFAAGPSSREVVQVGPSTFEIGDLPPIAISFTGWREHTDLGRRVKAPDGIRATARHGDPPVTVLRLRPVH